jgi:DNA-binding transcriptional LysR family regulator
VHGFPRRRTSVRLRHNPSLESQSPATHHDESFFHVPASPDCTLAHAVHQRRRPGRRRPERFALRFDRAQKSLDAAAQGLGVALESATNASGHIADGRLKPVFGLDKAVRVKAHFVVYPAHHAQRPPVEAFLAWIHGEAAKSAGS